jgi:hypothetical protein
VGVIARPAGRSAPRKEGRDVALSVILGPAMVPLHDRGGLALVPIGNVEFVIGERAPPEPGLARNLCPPAGVPIVVLSPVS